MLSVVGFIFGLLGMYRDIRWRSLSTCLFSSLWQRRGIG